MKLSFLSFFFQTIFAHTWMLTPMPRFSDLCIPVYDSSTCCGDIPQTDGLPVYTRGQTIPVEWGRNNHIGGFIKFSIAPLDLSQDPESFDTFQYSCFSSNCTGYGGSIYTGDPDGSGFNDVKCSSDVYLPEWLEDGAYTIQWRWHSGGDSRNIRELGLVDFVSCHDFIIQGGETTSEPACPLFVGGDESTPDLNTCEFFKSNEPDTCTDAYNCYGWFAKAPPREIMECPTRVTNKLNPNPDPGPDGRLFVGESKTPHNKPDNVESVDTNAIISQFTAQQC